MRRTRRFSCSGWSAPRWCCSASRSSSCAIRSSRSCGFRMPPETSARAAACPASPRVERTMEQRTTMLAGVSHSLRTVLTRFKLELALLGNAPEVEALKKDVDEMGRMLEAYLAFARGDLGEQSAPTDMAAFLDRSEEHTSELQS